MVVKRRNLVNRGPAAGPQNRYIYGHHAVTAWLQARPDQLHSVHYDVRLPERAAAFVELAAKAGVRCEPCGDEALTRMAGTPRHQGVVAAAAAFPYAEIEPIIESKPRLLVLADQIQDPQNLGAMLRTAEAVGAGAVLIPKDSSVGVTAAVEVAAAGAAALVPVCRITNAVRTLQQLKTAGYWTVGLVARRGTDLYDFDPPEQVVVVVGGETGMRSLVAKQCDFAVSIPMRGKVESLNASVAAAVVLYELMRPCPGKSSTIVSTGGAV